MVTRTTTSCNLNKHPIEYLIMNKDCEVEKSPLDHFNSGGVVIVVIPEGIKVVLQRNGSNVRVAITANGELDPNQFRKLIAEQGGHTAIVKSVLDSIGVTQKVEEGSGVFRSVQHNADPGKMLKDNFKW